MKNFSFAANIYPWQHGRNTKVSFLKSCLLNTILRFLHTHIYSFMQCRVSLILKDDPQRMDLMWKLSQCPRIEGLNQEFLNIYVFVQVSLWPLHQLWPLITSLGHLLFRLVSSYPVEREKSKFSFGVKLFLLCKPETVADLSLRLLLYLRTQEWGLLRLMYSKIQNQNLYNKKKNVLSTWPINIIHM